ncbi:TIGR03619 family F420-dependent LLM class oxidoreductase [Thermomonospora umbrina]|uniref:Putative F420-dependent oxidoreductase n=1 Tax=Thermomonospora umbrina TaxID=111806 RepID=A0A3D9T254_9ACTN|nr:TIGR03619 family F420-dependent LLM class oxidoreductase [Thermomonospora umbrina]REF00931.1 putative F420-dependent oxidoreductase [Thermomonospora umbrina]
MKVGFAVPVTGRWATPDNQARIARRAEELGYHSIWTLQRLLNPADSADLTYRNVPDPLVTLAYLAGLTDRVRLGVAVVNMPFFSPPLLAKQAATLDHVSGGRLDLGLGLGWMPAEFAATGAPSDRRGARAEEFIAALRALWTTDVSSYEGEFHSIPPVVMEPKPLQSPEPPLLLGGKTPPALRRAGRLAAGWISASGADLTTMDEQIAVVREAAERAGRDPDALRIVCRGAVRVRPPGRPDRRPLTGSFAEILDDCARLAADGVTELFVDLNFDPEITGPNVSPDASMERAEEALEALRPADGR